MKGMMWAGMLRVVPGLGGGDRELGTEGWGAVRLGGSRPGRELGKRILGIARG